MTTVNAPQYAQPAIVTNRWLRNGKYPDAAFQSDLAAQTAHAMAYLTKEVFSYSCPIASVPASGGDRDRWRFAWHSGPYARYLVMHVICVPGTLDTGGPGVTLTVTDGSTPLGVAQYISGAGSSGATDTPAYFSTGTAVLASDGAAVEIAPDTDLYGVVADLNNGRVLAISVFEVSLEPTVGNGYPGGVAMGGPVLDADRATVATALRSLWKSGAAHLLNWTVDLQGSPQTTTSANEVNLIDTSLTGGSEFGSAAPQFVLDIDNRTRVSGTGVPIVMKVYGSKGTGNGTVYLLADTSDVIATVTITGAAAWYSTTAVIDPALFSDPANASVHLTFKSAGGTCSVYAVSVYQYET